ncbi:ATP-binding protein [Paenibacillus pasadenensis]|uniref:histidine kinase n=1 Tax=Paenibacillus pasadenensis TaxID=217090 RepID=A0A2N5N036_9BACL|nr:MULTISPECIES: ATP-binding protein [Paenibacillus]PLT43698.1 Sporulation kinase A [Paenibacillus pasadenensis]QGG54324.1 PAS domain-containing sensor histidine kinase [Paenibacillus sp. B01]
MNTLEQWKRSCRDAGMDPSVMPQFRQRYSPQRLREQQERYAELLDICRSLTEELLESAPDDPILIAVNDSEGHLLGFCGNESMEELLGCKYGILPGVGYTRDMWPSSIAACMETGRPAQLVGTDHYHEPLHDTACLSAPLYLREHPERPWGGISFMLQADSVHPHLMALLRSMTASMERELELRRQNARQAILTQALLQTPYYGVVLVDAAGSIVSMNARSVELMELERPAEGDRCEELPIIGPSLREMIVQQGTEPVLACAIKEKSKDGQRHYMGDFLPVTEEDGRLLFIVAMLRDMTDAKRADDMLHGSEKLVLAGQIAVGIAHEIRNPLTVIRGMLQFTADRIKREHYELILSELDRIGLIVTDFMALGQQKAPQLRPEPADAIVEETLQMMEFQFKQEGIRIKRDYGGAELVYGDRNQIKQVLLNVLRNAAEAMPQGGFIEVRLRAGNGRQRIEIADTGEGMGEDQLARLGELFHTTKKGGSGLGLAIVKRIMDAHGSQIRFESEPGKGTTVVLDFPIYQIRRLVYPFLSS